MTLGKLRSIGRHPIVGRPAILLLFLWLFLMAIKWQPTGGWDDDPYVRLRYVERELLLLEAGTDGNQLTQWWTGASQGAKAYQDLRKILPRSMPEQSWRLDLAHQMISRKIDEHNGQLAAPFEWPEDLSLADVFPHDFYPPYVIEVAYEMNRDSELAAYLDETESSALGRSLIGCN